MPEDRTQIYEVTAPDGTVLEVTGPAGASDEQVVAVAQQMYQGQKNASALRQTAASGTPYRPEGYSTKDFQSGPMRLLSTAAEFLDPRPMISSAMESSRKSREHLGRAAESAGQGDLVGTAVSSVKSRVQPYVDAARSLLGIPGAVYDQAVEAGHEIGEGDFASGVTRGAGAIATALPIARAGVGAARRTSSPLVQRAAQVLGESPSRAITAEGLMTRANRARDYSQAHPVLQTLEQTDLTRPVSIPGNIGRATKSVAAKVAAPTFDLAARAKAALEGRGQVKSAPSVIDESAGATPETMAQLDELTPPKNMQHPGIPEPEIRGASPETMAQLDDVARGAELDRTLQQRLEAAFNAERQRELGPEPFAQGPNMPPEPTQYSPAPGAFELPAQRPRLVPAEVENLQRAINAPGERGQQWVVQNAEKVLDVAPELKNLAPGPEFQMKAINAYDRVDQAMHAAERSVPPDTVVDTMPLKADLTDFQRDLAAQGRQADVTMVEKLIGNLDAGLMPWDAFTKLKSGIYKMPGASKPAMRRAYSYFIKAAGRVSPELMKASGDYAVMRRVLEFAKIDPLTRRPLKPPKP